MACSDKFSLSSSPPGRLHLAEGSDLFKAVMEEFMIDSESNFELKSERTKTNTSSKRNGCENETNNLSFCQRLSNTEDYESRCHRVHWVDEDTRKPLAMEITEASSKRSDSFSKSEVKPILKHRATCLVIVSGS
ncbi:hypothetical protein CHS0354_011009 [Potamilus streckersoni]|uniref:Uncharacterized protein n=1 Tax=Potamilus streckersoni TaxID=2493646 RepID=A0AAE0TKW2_9BIVA|nr:hypothetical protein CHS0354_011009 [Potamilus streckersoni]